MSDPYVGEIRLLAFPRVPNGWFACNGQSVSVAEFQALYAVIGTTYGGDGQSSFNVPNLQGRIAIGRGQGIGLPNYALGQPGGEEMHTLTEPEMPVHSHAMTSSTATAETQTPGPTLHLGTATAGTLYAPAANIPSYDLMATCVTPAGSSIPHDNMMPTLTCNYCICWAGIFPTPG